MGARAAAHVALATRGSRLAVYDLREALEAAREPLPVEFLAALTLAGDASCLEPIAAAYARAAGDHADAWWPRHLADAFQSIVSREGLTRRHAVVKKIEKRWPDALRALWQRRTR
jgi:HEAT repeat protein